jgi:hypothetical protein
MSDNKNTPADSIPPLAAHADFVLRQRMWSDPKGWEIARIQEQGTIPITDWFNCIDFVIESGSSPPPNQYTLDGRRPVGMLKFQDGPIKEVGINGVQVEHVIDVCWNRLITLAAPYGSMDEETEKAVNDLKSAARWLEARKARRERERTEGTSLMTESDGVALVNNEPRQSLDLGGYTEPVEGVIDEGGYEKRTPIRKER